MARKSAPAARRRAVPAAPDPQHRWDRPIQAPGHMQVDFEERVDFRRLHESSKRLARGCEGIHETKHEAHRAACGAKRHAHTKGYHQRQKLDGTLQIMANRPARPPALSDLWKHS